MEKVFSKILIIDFGSQYTQLIARKIRESEVYCEIYPFNSSYKKIKDFKPDAIILSGGPSSVYDSGAPFITKEIFNIDVPFLGICYGMQIMAYLLSGEVKPAKNREYGHSKLAIIKESKLFKGCEKSSLVWMSHGDIIVKTPPDFVVTSQTENCSVASFENSERKLYGLQFHPEVAHTACGRKILNNFLFNIAKVKKTWKLEDFIENKVREIRNLADGKKAICALSGGVDSTVAAVLANKAIGDKLRCIFVDNGLLRENEGKAVIKFYKENLKLNVKLVNASNLFLKALKGIEDPEKKRKIIGKLFIEIFEKEAKNIADAGFLVQGTLYPDVIESVRVFGASSIIKSHHNVGGLPKKLNLKLIEPLRELFKDEVRIIGKNLRIPAEIISRQPFPGPGLAIRIIGDVDKNKLNTLRQADTIVTEEIKKSGLEGKVWQSFPVLIPVKTVGVMGDKRSYESLIALRAVSSSDGMTADFVKLDYDILRTISARIISEVKGINRVVYDITSKPPSTIEWE
ncbi:MAG: glutamine-hydrolyzing GMP synthase [Deltaproteobacteria bacterium]|nr:glutamine-hydrolyzing GMP synthase [Deltaproteobacteria bacterium]MCL5893098.1 glutamine-hydrolyzing GMP synthase [Deltaproteobacteria bacterium]